MKMPGCGHTSTTARTIGRRIGLKYFDAAAILQIRRMAGRHNHDAAMPSQASRLPAGRDKALVRHFTAQPQICPGRCDK